MTLRPKAVQVVASPGALFIVGEDGSVWACVNPMFGQEEWKRIYWPVFRCASLDPRGACTLEEGHDGECRGSRNEAM